MLTDTTRSVSSSQTANHLVSRLEKDVYKKLATFCKNQVLKSGLTTKTDSSDYDVSEKTGTVNRRRVFAKLRLLFKKFLTKSMPYLQFANSEFLEVNDQNSFMVKFNTPKGIRDFTGMSSDIDAVSSAISLGNTLKETKVYARYARYLNYLFRKYEIPFHLVVEPYVIFDGTEVEEVMAITDIAEQKSKKISNHINYVFQFIPTIWTVRGTNNISIYNDLVQRYKETLDLKGNPNIANFYETALNKFYSDPTNWTRNSYFTNNMRSTYYRMERVFFHLEKCIRIFRTLTRKINYGYKPYIFRTAKA